MGEVKKGFNLQEEFKGKTVKILPIKRSSWITDPNHEAAFLVGPATRNYSAPMDRNGNIVCPLSDEERAYFENPEISGMSYTTGDLSPYKEKGNFWKRHKIRLGKDPKVLRLDQPKDFIDYKLLLANKDEIAPSYELSKKKRSYKFMIVSEETAIDTRLTKQKKLQEAYMFLGKVNENKAEMSSFLRIHGKRIPLDATEKWLQDEMGKVIESALDAFLAIARDNDRKTRLMILDAVEAGIVLKDGRKFFLQGGEPLAGSGEVPLMATAVAFLKMKKNQDILTDIKARLETAKD
tara:strand:+ start:10742 stop:11620 length:879 start_codon:yes stop_codon:yes gene_type:complete